MTKLICVINNFNYSKYLSECIDSALSQTISFDKVIVVDDGSTDNSREIIENYALIDKRIKPILKTNDGQLSCFNAAVEFIPEDAQVFLMDSDDIFPRNYIEALHKKVTFPNDFIFVTAVSFNELVPPLQDSEINNDQNIHFPKTRALVLARQVWIGNVTSPISVSGVIFKKIVPYPHFQEWKTRADDVFIYIASILGVAKTMVQSVGIAYRKHATNDHVINADFYNSDIEKLLRKERLKKLFDFYCNKYEISKSEIFNEILWEYDASGKFGKEYLKSLGLRLF